MSVLLHFLSYVCYELFLKFEQQFLFRIQLSFMLIDLLGKFYGGNCMIDSSFVYHGLVKIPLSFARPFLVCVKSGDFFWIFRRGYLNLPF
jgi:hypothetical protein